MVTVRKFMFDTCFDPPCAPEPLEPLERDEPGTPEGDAEVEPEPTFSQAEVDAARQAGFAAGKEDGIKEAADAVERRAADALAALAEGMTEVFRLQGEANDALARNGVAVAVAVARKLFPELSRRNAVGEVERVAEEVFKRTHAEPRIIARVNETLAEPLGQRLREIAAARGFEGRLLIAPDAAIEPSECRIEWSDGSAERRLETIWQEIDEILRRNLGAALPEPIAEVAADRDDGRAAAEDIDETGTEEDRRAGAEEAEAGETDGRGAIDAEDDGSEGERKEATDADETA
jgi:flagellar assembly protein FliH